MRQIGQMESEELLAQKKLRTQVIQLEDMLAQVRKEYEMLRIMMMMMIIMMMMLAQVRKEYEMLRIEFEQNLAANEQTWRINKEMRNLITSLQTHNVQLKGEVARLVGVFFLNCWGGIGVFRVSGIRGNSEKRKELDDIKRQKLKLCR